MKKGICCAGNMIVYITYPIETCPKQNELTHITEGITRSTGGSVCNTISDLARLDPTLPLVASGFAGHDAEGDFVLREMGKHKNIDLSMVRRSGDTSFTAVMSNNRTKERTFFQYAGGNAYYGEDDIDWDKLDVDISTSAIFSCCRIWTSRMRNTAQKWPGSCIGRRKQA